MTHSRFDVTRRRFGQLIGAAAVGTLAAPAIIRAQDRTLTVRDPGGPYAQGFKEAFYDPFFEATGIQVTGVQGDHAPTGLIASMVDAGNYTWDGSILSDNAHQVLVAQNYLEPIEVTDAIREVPEQLRTEYLMGTDVVGVILAYRTDTMGEGALTRWADVWDVEGRPGLRALRRSAFDTTEQALLADGVSGDSLYPLDFDRAFAALDRLKDDVAIWWTGGAQTSQLLATGEVDVLPTWNARAQTAIDDGAPVMINWNEALYTFEGWGILRGGPKVDLMQEFVSFCAQGPQQALFTPHLASGPTNPSAYATIPEERAAVLPSNPVFFDNMVKSNAGFWGGVGDEANERFNAWVLS
ncbi:MAG: ABC transporter substrate-binding protein [Devosiaceae bacterium]|nr:ABC transporter substrate-binding protein [Devosiaceae bacterium MH13]